MEIEVSGDVLRGRSLMMGTLMYGGQASGQFLRSMCELTLLYAHRGVSLSSCFLLNESLITRARAEIAAPIRLRSCASACRWPASADERSLAGAEAQKSPQLFFCLVETQLARFGRERTRDHSRASVSPS